MNFLLKRWVFLTCFKVYNVFPPFNYSILKYNLLPACLYKWFGQNKTTSIYSTFLIFPSFWWLKFDLKISDLKMNVFITITATKLEKSEKVEV